MSFAASLAYLALAALLLPATGENSAGVEHRQLHLANGWKPGTGRVEIWDHTDNMWKTICDDYEWDLNDSHVVCRQLGFPGASRWYSSFADKKHVFFNGLGNCHGNESYLDDCLSGSSECFGHFDPNVAVECEAPVRLVDGQYGNEGRVEVYKDGVWATVCGESLDLYTANVLCEYMDFKSATEVIKQSASQGSGSVLSVNCKGKSLMDNCTIKPSDCSHEWDARLVCQLYPEAAVRLIEATSPLEGFIIIHHNGSWGAVCNDHNGFDLKDAGVVCRQLGYGSANDIKHGEWGTVDNAVTVVLEYYYYQLHCNGSESNLMECPHSGNARQCLRNQPAGVKCSEFDATQSEIELVKGSSRDPNGTGLLLLIYKAPDSNLTAKPVCYAGWDIADAQVACRQMGYNYASSTHSTTGYGKYYSKEQNAWLDSVQCTGIEKALYNCLHTGWGDYSCYFSGFVAISCSNEHPSIRITLTGGRHAAEGLLQVEYQGRMGTVCGDGWSMNAATVACRQLGYTAALRTSSGEEFGGRPSAMWMSYVTCSGSEAKLQDCTHSGLGDFSKSCTHPIGVGVVCGDPPFSSPPSDMSVRLVGQVEEKVTMGRVEIFHSGQWLGLCMDNLGRSEAQAICHSLNYVDGLPIMEATAQYFGLGYSTSWITELACSDSGSSARGMAACSTIGWSPGSCRTAQPGVLCSAVPLSVENVKWQLNGGRREGEGIVEVGIGGTWGAICIDHWEMHAAKLICRSLGYQTALASVKNIPIRTKFVVRDRLHFVNQVRCSGRETSISECDIVWETGQCHGERDTYAGVVCSDADVSLPLRLVAGRNKYEGNVQLQYEGEWGYVCGAVWDITAADVVCKQLKSKGAARVKTFKDYSMCRVWLDQVNCRGDEASIWDCSHTGLGIFQGTCSVSEYAGVVCKEADIVQIDRSAPTDHIELACNAANHRYIGIPNHKLVIRLVSFGKNSTTTGRGRVEIFARRTWGSICDDGWDLHAANVTCKSLGFEGAERIAEVEEFGKGTGHIWLDDIKCVGTEISLDFCNMHGLGRSDCIHSEDAGVVCITNKVTSDPTTKGSINSVTVAVISTMAVLVTVLAVTVLIMCLRRKKKPRKSSILEAVLQDTSSQAQEENGTEQESDISAESTQ